MLTLTPPPSETLDALHQRLLKRELTSQQLVERCLARIDEWEPRVRAWVSVDRDGALAQARECDAELARGTVRGTLHGIPIGIKDIIDVAGWPTAAGAGWYADGPKSHDAELVARLRRAGAVILGKTVTTEFASFDPPVTRNPWNVAHTPGGSSSGSAAAVACGMCFAAIGSQTGGSITRPAAFCGVAGLKPTHGRGSLRGIVPLAPSMDHPGPLARTVRDLGVLLGAISPHDPLDPLSSTEPTPQISAALASPLSPPRIAVLGGFFETRADPEALRILQAALARFADAGADVAAVGLPPEFDDVPARHRCVMAVECAAVHEPLFAQHAAEYGRHIRALVEDGLAARATDYVRAREHQRTARTAILNTLGPRDVLATLAAVGPAPLADSTGDPAFNAPWSYTGLPTISFPIGLTQSGLPISIQLIGRPCDEESLFRSAVWCEERAAGSA